MNVKKIVVLVLAMVIMVPFSASAGAEDLSGAETLIKEAMAEAISIINNQETPLGEKRKKLWKVALRSFDFEIIAQFTLGKFSATSKADLGAYSNRRFSPKEQKEFTEVFKDHLGNIYLDRLESDTVNIQIQIMPLEPLKPRKGMPRARINTLLNEITPIDYMLFKQNSQWRIYDVKVEGRSLVASFRKEYKTFLMQKTPAQLISMLKEKNRRHDNGNSSK